jgi:hypothetical protein
MLLQHIFNGDQAFKVTTYKALFSPVSSDAVGSGVGKVIHVPVSKKDNVMNHGIKQICDSMGGDWKISKTWNNT